jgi:hypothetical protein
MARYSIWLRSGRLWVLRPFSGGTGPSTARSPAGSKAIRAALVMVLVEVAYGTAK